MVGFEDARRRLTAIHKSALTYLEEKGIETLFVAVGLATWEVDSGAPPNAPVILLPIAVHAAGAAARDFRFQVVGDAHLNPVLAHTLRVDHEIDTDEDESEFAESPPVSFKGYLSLLNRLQSKWNSLTNLKVEPRVVVAVFFLRNHATRGRFGAERRFVRGKRHHRGYRRRCRCPAKPCSEDL